MIGAITAGLFSTGVAASTTSYESIASVSVGLLGASTIDFTSIPSTYKHLQLRLSLRGSPTGSFISPPVQFNGDTASNYGQHYLVGSGTAASSGANTPSSAFFYPDCAGSTAAANCFAATVLDILDYANTNKYKTGRALTGLDLNGSGDVELISAAWRSTAAVTSIKITAPSSGTFLQYSHAALYGIKG
jgi:hypothetical protein